jgi:hypothetical protein
MTGKDLLDHFLQYYENVYARSLTFTTNDEEKRYRRRDAIAATIDRLYTVNYISPIDHMKFLKLIQSPDQENWVIVESIIENININDIQKRDEQIQI